MYESIRSPTWSGTDASERHPPAADPSHWPDQTVEAGPPEPSSLRQEYERLRWEPDTALRRSRFPAGAPTPSPRERGAAEVLVQLAQAFRRRLLQMVSEARRRPISAIDPFDPSDRQAIEQALVALRPTYGAVPLTCLITHGPVAAGQPWRIDDAMVAQVLLDALRRLGMATTATSEILAKGVDGDTCWHLHHIDGQLFHVTTQTRGAAEPGAVSGSMRLPHLTALARTPASAALLAAATHAFLSSCPVSDLLQCPEHAVTSPQTASRLLRRLGAAQALTWARDRALGDVALSALLAGASSEEHPELLDQLHQRLAGRSPSDIIALSGGEHALAMTWRHPHARIGKAWMTLMLDVLPWPSLMRIFRNDGDGGMLMPAVVMLQSPRLISSVFRRLMEDRQAGEVPTQALPGLLSPSCTVGDTTSLLSLSRHTACAGAWLRGLAKWRHCHALDDDRIGQLLGSASTLDDCLQRAPARPSALSSYVNLLFQARDVGVIHDDMLERMLAAAEGAAPGRSALARACAQPRAQGATAYLRLLFELTSAQRLGSKRLDRLLRATPGTDGESPLQLAWQHRQLDVIKTLLEGSLDLTIQARLSVHDWRTLITQAAPGGRGLWEYRSTEPLSRRTQVLFDVLTKAEAAGVLDEQEGLQLRAKFLPAHEPVYANGPR